MKKDSGVARRPTNSSASADEMDDSYQWVKLELFDSLRPFRVLMPDGRVYALPHADAAALRYQLWKRLGELADKDGE